MTDAAPAPGAFTGERLSGAGGTDFAVDMERHLAAYRYAAPRAAGRTVLDAGCGEGYGAALLAETATRVVGLDVAEAVATARVRHVLPNLEYRITMGGRAGETAWKHEINNVIAKRQGDIDKILMEFGVPLVDEDNKLITEPRYAKGTN